MAIRKISNRKTVKEIFYNAREDALDRPLEVYFEIEGDDDDPYVDLVSNKVYSEETVKKNPDRHFKTVGETIQDMLDVLPQDYNDVIGSTWEAYDSLIGSMEMIKEIVQYYMDAIDSGTLY